MARLVAKRDMGIQKEEFKHFGIMADWSDRGTYRTMGMFVTTRTLSFLTCETDHNYEMRQLRVLQELVSRGKLRSRPSTATHSFPLQA
jgi:isoleucyl-tRNA synthetase